MLFFFIYLGVTFIIIAALISVAIFDMSEKRERPILSLALGWAAAPLVALGVVLARS